MKSPITLVALTFAAFLPSLVPAFGAPEPKPNAPAKAPVKPVADPLGIPAFAPVPTEFVFAGTQKDVYKLLSRYTGGISLADMPEPTTEELVAIQKGKDAEDGANFAALLEVKRLLSTLHVVRVRSVSYRAASEKERAKALEDSAPKTQEAPAKGIEGSIESGITSFGDSSVSQNYDREQELLANAETFYQEMLTKQGGKIQMQLRGETSISVYALAQPQTFAVVTRGPARVIVARADGKPDVGVITNIFQRVISN